MSITNIWKIETGHSQIQFKIKHLAITNVNGIFKTFEGTVYALDDTFDNAVIKVAITADSLDTQLPPRDIHVKSAHLFDVENYPIINFEGVLKKEGEGFIVDGDLTIKDVSNPIRLDAQFTGNAKGFAGDERAGFEATGKLSRKDFGLTWNIAAEGGGLVIGDEIKLYFDIQLTK